MAGMIRILIVDDEIFFTVGVRQILSHEEDLVLFDCHACQDLQRVVGEFLPDVVLLGCELADRISLPLAREISSVYPAPRVVVISHDPQDEDKFRIIKNSVTDCLGKNARPQDLGNVVRKAYRGKYLTVDSFLDKQVLAEQLGNDSTQMPPISGKNHNPTVALAFREEQILTYISEGNTNKEIVRLLGVSEQTVKTHVSAILRKLSANDRAHAVALAMRCQSWRQLEHIDSN